MNAFDKSTADTRTLIRDLPDGARRALEADPQARAALAEGMRRLGGGQGTAPKSITVNKLSGARKEQHMAHRRAGRTWRPIGLGQLVGTGSAIIYLGGDAATSLKIDSALYDARLCFVNDGGTATYLAGLTVDGKTVYTGSKLSVAVCLVGKATGVVDACDKDAGLPLGDVKNTFNVGVYIETAGDTVEVFVNAYVEGFSSGQIDNDDDAPGGGE